MTVDIKFLNTSTNPDPEYKTEGSSGFDLAAAETVVIEGGDAALVPTGIHLIIPKGYEGQLRLRSSMYSKFMVMPNAPGTIDSDYNGEIFIPVRNTRPWTPITISQGHRIAQVVINKLPEVSLRSVNADEFASNCVTERGDAGFGSTGTGLDPKQL